MRWPWRLRRPPDATSEVDRYQTLADTEVTAQAAQEVAAQSVLSAQVKLDLQQSKEQLRTRLESNHFRDKVELALFGRELR